MVLKSTEGSKKNTTQGSKKKTTRGFAALVDMSDDAGTEEPTEIEGLEEGNETAAEDPKAKGGAITKKAKKKSKKTSAPGEASDTVGAHQEGKEAAHTKPADEATSSLSTAVANPQTNTPVAGMDNETEEHKEREKGGDLAAGGPASQVSVDLVEDLRSDGSQYESATSNQGVDYGDEGGDAYGETNQRAGFLSSLLGASFSKPITAKGQEATPSVGTKEKKSIPAASLPGSQSGNQRILRSQSATPGPVLEKCNE